MVSVSEEIGIGHAERIAPAFVQLLENASVEASSIRRIGVTVGPGSFMGQRVGSAFAKGLVTGGGAETVPLTTLEALAYGRGEATVAIDARRGQVYFQKFGEDGGATEEPALLDHQEAAGRLGQGQLIGSGIAACSAREATGPHVPTVDALIELTEKGSPQPLGTLYLRDPDAKPPARPPL